MATKRDLPAADPALGTLTLRFHEREETVECPGDYAPHTVTFWTNPPDQLRLAATSDGALMLRVIRAWTFETTDSRPAPITEAALAALPADLFSWLVTEWVTRNRRPLATPPSAERRNGTPVTETLSGRPLSVPVPS